MIFTTQSYADFVSLCKTVDAAPKVAYFAYPAGQSYFMYGYLPTSGLLVQFLQGGVEEFPSFLTDFPDALSLNSTITIQGDKFLSFNNLADYVTFLGAMPPGVAKIVFGVDETTLEAYAVVGSLVVELMASISSVDFLIAFPTAVQLQSRAECSADYTT